MSDEAGVVSTGRGDERRIVKRQTVSSNSKTHPRISTFTDLDVYRQTYDASLIVITQLISLLPMDERYDLRSQLSRSCKAVPRLIAEGYAKRHQKRGFQKYLDDATGECNELIVSLSHCRDLYGAKINPQMCEELIDLYDKSARQLFKLATAWASFVPRRRYRSPLTDTPFVTDNRLTTPEPQSKPLESDHAGSVTDNRTT